MHDIWDSVYEEKTNKQTKQNRHEPSLLPTESQLNFSSLYEQMRNGLFLTAKSIILSSMWKEGQGLTIHLVEETSEEPRFIDMGAYPCHMSPSKLF